MELIPQITACKAIQYMLELKVALRIDTRVVLVMTRLTFIIVRGVGRRLKIENKFIHSNKI